MLAAELVLGLPDADERAALTLRAEREPDFGARVWKWEQRLSPLLAEVTSVEPPRDGWKAVTRRLFAQPDRLQRQLRWWQAGTGAMTAVAAALALILLLPHDEPPVSVREPQVADQSAVKPELAVAQLSDEGGTPLLAIGIERRSGQVRVRLQDLPREARVPELWIIPKGGAPRSMGLIRADGTLDRALPQDVRQQIGADATLAVSLESPEGAPHAAPAGPIVATGPLVTL